VRQQLRDLACALVGVDQQLPLACVHFTQHHGARIGRVARDRGQHRRTPGVLLVSGGAPEFGPHFGANLGQRTQTPGHVSRPGAVKASS